MSSAGPAARALPGLPAYFADCISSTLAMPVSALIAFRPSEPSAPVPDKMIHPTRSF